MHRTSFAHALIASIVCAPLWALSPIAAQANSSRWVHVGALGGLSLPGGSLTMFAKTGWNASLFVSMGRPRAPLSFRLDGQWEQFYGKAQVAGDRPTEFDDFRVFDATANAVYSFPGTSATTLYVIVGGGIYDERSTMRVGSLTVNESLTKPGVNAGVGVHFQLQRVAALLEIRYHYVVHGGDLAPYNYLGDGHAGMHFVPVSVGIVL